MSVPVPTIAASLLAVTPFSFDRTLRKVELMSRNPDCTTALLSNVIGSDPMLSAAILARAQATAGPQQEPVVRLSQAITMLGMSMVQGVVLRIHPIEESYRRTLAACWGLANATATMTRIIAEVARAQALRSIHEETLHLAGLLHDLGSAVGQRLFTEAYLAAVEDVAHDRNLVLETALVRHLSVNSTALSTLLARNWGLADRLTACMRYARRPMRAAEGDRPLVCTVHVARTLVRGCGFTMAGDPYVEPIDDAALDLLGLRFGDLEDAIRLFHDELDELELYEGVLGG